MLENLQGSFMLNNGNAAVSADLKGGNVFAADGFCNYLWEYGQDGDLLCQHPAVRPYRRFRYNENACVTTALGCCNGNSVYILDKDLKELGYVSLNGLQRDGCTSYGGLTDASVTVIGNELFFVGAFFDGAFLFDIQGKRLARLCAVERNETLTDFISAGDDIYAMAVICDNTQIITVARNGIIYNGILSPKYTLRMLFYKNGCVYGLFGQGYIYNRIFKIFSEGVFYLPR